MRKNFEDGECHHDQHRKRHGYPEDKTPHMSASRASGRAAYLLGVVCHAAGLLPGSHLSLPLEADFYCPVGLLCVGGNCIRSRHEYSAEKWRYLWAVLV